MNDDTVIGKCRNYHPAEKGGGQEPVDLTLDDLDEPYRSYLDGTPAAVELALSQLKRIAELEARLAKTEAALKAADEFFLRPSRVNEEAYEEARRQAREAVK